MNSSGLSVLLIAILLLSSCDSHSPISEEDKIIAKFRQYDFVDGVTQGTFVDYDQAAFSADKRIELQNFPHVYVKSDK